MISTNYWIATIVASLMATEISAQTGFGFRVCKQSFHRHGNSGGKFTVDYQLGPNRYSCVINGAQEFWGVYTCESSTRIDQCLDTGKGDFMQISNDGNDDVAYCAIIFNGEEISVPARMQLGDNSKTYKRRYDIDSGKIVSQSAKPSGYNHAGRVAPECESLPVTGFGFRVCKESFHRHGNSGGVFTVDYQLGLNRYSCVIDGAQDFNGVYTCESEIAYDLCFGGDFLQISNDGNDDVAYCSIIFDGEEISVPARMQLGDNSKTYKRRYDMDSGEIVSEIAKPNGFNKPSRVVPECCQFIDCYEPRC